MPKAPPVHRAPGWVARKPFANSRTASKRIAGRALQTRNDRIKLRDRFACALCGRVTTDGEVDHRIPLAQGGTEDDSNLQWLCKRPCHANKTISEGGRDGGRVKSSGA